MLWSCTHKWNQKLLIRQVGWAPTITVEQPKYIPKLLTPALQLCCSCSSWRGKYLMDFQLWKKHLIIGFNGLDWSDYQYSTTLIPIYTYSKKISDVKKGEPKKVQVTEQLKSGKSLWGQEEKIYQQGCVELQHTSKLSKYTIFLKIHN